MLYVIFVFFVNRMQLFIVFLIFLFSGVFLSILIVSITGGIRDRLEFFKDGVVLGGTFGS